MVNRVLRSSEHLRRMLKKKKKKKVYRPISLENGEDNFFQSNVER